MKPLSSLDGNCEAHSRFRSQFCKIRGPHSPANLTASKVLAAARVGRRARYKKTIHHRDGKENREAQILTHLRDCQQSSAKQTGVKRKTSVPEGDASLLANKCKRSSLSTTLEVMTSIPKSTLLVPMESPEVTNHSHTMNGKDTQAFTKSGEKVNPSSQEESSSLLELKRDKKGEVTAMQESSGHEVIFAAANPSTSVGLCLPDGSQEQSKCLSSLGSSDKSMPRSLPPMKSSGVIVSLPCSKPPKYPKAKESVQKVKGSSPFLLDASRCKEAGIIGSVELIINGGQPPCSQASVMDLGYAKIEESSLHITGQGGLSSKACGSQVDQTIFLQVETIKDWIPQSAAVPDKVPTLSLHSSHSSANASCQSNKGFILTDPSLTMETQAANACASVVGMVEVKREPEFQEVADMCGNVQAGGIKGSLRELNKRRGWHPPVLLASKVDDHSLNNFGLANLHCARPSRKSNLCPCPEKMEKAQKFAQIGEPSGLFGKLNPGIITTLRDKKQVHAILEAVIQDAFISNRRESFKSQGAAKPTNIREGKGRQAHALGENRSASMDGDVPWSEKEVGQLNPATQQECCSAGGLLTFQSAQSATASGIAAEHMASCWLELLRLDIKGRLSALKRSRRRVRTVIVSGRLDEKVKQPFVVDAEGKTNETDEMMKWRAFFLHMDGVLYSEGTRLESWLHQIAQMQSQSKKTCSKGCPTPLCDMPYLNPGTKGVTR